ncbi:hypothetical protein QJS10_CPB19g01582 [Acorus calamus]|uniref:Peptidase A1 domain-containing protein n=1 Tax=Acorus calamus TaxID=4465 RepID=A0AAV9CJX9_ACOCL|nr:hypothetical protein QJS10_CPB19g01582 [Acorus calamus]
MEKIIHALYVSIEAAYEPQKTIHQTTLEASDARVVIITLPPPDDPSKGKTITAYTISENPNPNPQQQQHQRPLAIRSNPPLRISARRAIATLAATALVFLTFWSYFFSDAPLGFLREGRDDPRRRRPDESRSFILPLYPKSGGGGDRLGLRPEGDVKLRSAGDESGRTTRRFVNASAVLPVRGNVFPDGCAYDQQGQLLVSPAKTDGILGLSNAEVSLPSQLVSQGVIRDVIGHCISGDAAGGGYLMLGDDYVPLWGMSWVQMLLGPMNYYEAEVQKMSYGGQNLAIGGSISNTGRVIFDTGSSYTYFTKEAYLGLISSLKDISPRLTLDTSDETLPVCWRADFPVRNKWWVLQTSLQIPPEGYLIISKKGNVCLGILDGSEVHDGLTNILGDISLRGQLVVYDNINQKIGWVESDCTKPYRLNSFPFF